MSVNNPIIRDGMYCGNITPEQARLILNIREQTCIEEIKHMIFNFPKEMIDMANEAGLSVREFVSKNGIDHRPYIGELRDYQTVGTAFLWKSPRSTIGDGVGLGKTVQIGALFNVLRQKGELTRFIMAVEKSAIRQTYTEMCRFTGMKIVILPSLKNKMQKCLNETDWSRVDGIITSHSALKSDTLSAWLSLYKTGERSNRLFNTFILDESSLIKNNKTKNYEYIKNICDIAERVHFMNATVFETNILDIYFQMDTMYPELLPAKSKIEHDYCSWQRSKKGFWTKDKTGKAMKKFPFERSGYKNQEIFKNSLKLVYFGRSKKDVGINTPNEYRVYTVDATAKQKAAITFGGRYPEILNCPINVPECEIPFTRKDVPKLDRLCQLAEEEFQDSSIMIYCFNINAQEVIKEEMEKIGRKPVILNGKVLDDERDAVISGFNNGTYDVIITNIKKSLNLYGGDVCILYSLEVNPSKMTQLAGRIDRNVDDKIKTFILLLYENSPEYDYFTNTVKVRAKDSRDLTIDAESAVDLFIQYMEE